MHHFIVPLCGYLKEEGDGKVFLMKIKVLIKLFQKFGPRQGFFKKMKIGLSRMPLFCFIAVFLIEKGNIGVTGINL